MPLAAVDVCNQALALLGQKAITDLNGGDVHSRLCAAVYSTVRDELLSVREWAFATKWRRLSPDTLAPTNPRWTNRYAVPSGVLRVLEACTDAGETDLQWVLENGYILTEDLAGAAPSGSAVIGDVIGVGAHASEFTWVIGGAPINVTDVRVSFHFLEVGEVVYCIVNIGGANAFVAAMVEPHVFGGAWPTAMNFSDYADRVPGDPDALAGLTLQLTGQSPNDPPVPTYLADNLWYFDIGSPRIPGTGSLLVRTLEQIVDPSTWPPYFVAAVVARLAYELAIPVTENMQALAAMERRAVAKLREAAAVDGMQGRNLTRRTDTLANKRRG